MEHPASLSPGYTWRAAAIVAAAVATLELVLLVVVVIAAFAKPFSSESVRTADLNPPAGKATSARADAPKTAPGASSAPSTPRAKLPRSETAVIVLNGNGISGAAEQASSVVRSLRYVVAGTANAPRSDFARSLVMYRPGFRGEAIRLAQDVRVKRVVPLDGMRAADLEGAHVAIILGQE